ncbi:MAG: pseudouridine synthase [Lachnospiraceae bacterium]|nr:pseudouridine synthase [Lachnospiraceae bacterium]
MEKETMRLNKYLSAAGVCSRREADRLIAAGEVLVDGCPADMGMQVTEENQVICRGVPVKLREEPIVLAVNKPVGIVCTTAADEPDNIVDFIHYPHRIYPVGRLDKMSEGLILMTNQGEMMDRILRGSNYHEKEYLVTVNRPVDLAFLQAMRGGVPILDTVTRPCTVEKVSYNTFRIILTQGLNRQIRRMCEALDYRVVRLKRIRIMNIRLGDLKVGTWRKVEGEELRVLLEALK